MQKKIILSLIFCLATLSTISAQTYSGGNGTETSPYLISSKADMEALATAVNSGNSYSGKYFLLTQDLTDITTVIGNSNTRYFSGTFDGGGHTVDVNIDVNISSASGAAPVYAYAGVFGYISGATIKNLGVTGSVSVSASSSRSASYVGGICGSSGGTISNCYNTGSVSVSSSASSGFGSDVGGICGSSSGIISNCYNTGSVSFSTSVSFSSSFVGGICGFASRDISIPISISNCHNTGSVSATAPSFSSSSSDVGGILGNTESCNISNCYNTGSVSSSSSSAGGICAAHGSYGGVISNCYNTGGISGNIAGGICGREEGTISNCYNIGDIFATSQGGGICGRGSEAKISNCFAAGTSITVSSSIVGRIAGYNGRGSIENCHALSTMTVNGATVNSSDAASEDGKDADFSSFQTQSWFATNLPQWDFSTVWEMSSVGSINQGLPVFNTQPQQTYTITASAGSNGSISPTGNISVSQGGSQTFTFTPNTGYEINQVLVDGVNNTSAVSSGTYTFSNVTTSHTISVTFKQKQYTITVSAGTNGNISPSTNQTVSHGGSKTFTFTPNTGYEINQVLVDGVNNTAAVSSGSYTFNNVTTNHTISVTFKQKQYTISVSAGTNGNISPSTNQIVSHGDSKTFTFTPNTGYEINQVLIDGVNNTSAVSSGTYTFSNVTTNHTISVTFKQKSTPTYTITASAGSNGSISPTGNISVSQGGSQTFTFTPNTGYETNQVLVDGLNNTTAVSAGSYTFTNVTANHTISVTFRQKQYTITASTGSNGSISPTGSVSVSQGGSQTFTFTPNTGYEINQVLIDGVNNTTAVSAGSYTFTNVTANHTISVSFKQKATPTYTITASAGSNGSISPNGSRTVSQGGSQTFTFTPNTGYEINQVLVDGVNNASAVSSGTYTFTNVTANHTISVSFKQKATPTYTITASAGSNGSISPNGNISISQGGSQTFTFIPNTGYEINQVLVDGVNNTLAVSAGSYTFTNVTANHTISVTFRQKQYTITASAGANGTISPNGSRTVSQGGSQTFTFTPNTGYEINQVLVDGVNNASAVSSGTYTFTNVTANHTISVTFKQKQYTINVSAGANGRISPSTNQTVSYGASRGFTFTPNTGYKINQVLVDGVNNTAAVSSGAYTFTNVTANHTISVSFSELIPIVKNLVIQVWDDVLSVINEPANNGGYSFLSYQWQEDNVDMPGEISGNLYLAENPNAYTSYYAVRLTTTDGKHLQTYPVKLTKTNLKVSAYPNPTQNVLTVESAAINAGEKIEIYNSSGFLVWKYTAEKHKTTLNLSALPEGIYILKINNERVKIVKTNK
ncbi:MAG: T9SS type A sorting domain-containing protein [Dysgonamonadaceae bacterium]|jgi:ribosomal 50S subunit-recycling heat shock protein|nr:T9SS type A sorting domain-containing protein [Dysgonamonadaceae bacterium]